MSLPTFSNVSIARAFLDDAPRQMHALRGKRAAHAITRLNYTAERARIRRLWRGALECTLPGYCGCTPSSRAWPRRPQ